MVFWYPLHEKGRIDQEVRPRHIAETAGEGCNARSAIHQQRIMPLAPVGRDPDAEIVAADQTHFRAPAETALIELRQNTGFRALVEHDAQIARSALLNSQRYKQSRIELRR